MRPSLAVSQKSDGPQQDRRTNCFVSYVFRTYCSKHRYEIPPTLGRSGKFCKTRGGLRTYGSKYDTYHSPPTAGLNQNSISRFSYFSLHEAELSLAENSLFKKLRKIDCHISPSVRWTFSKKLSTAT